MTGALLLLVKISLVFVVAFAAARALRRSAALAAHGLWSATFAAVLALPLLAVSLPTLGLPWPDARLRASHVESPTPLPTGSISLQRGDHETAAPMLPRIAPEPSSYRSWPHPSLVTVLVALWLSGVALGLLAIGTSLLRVAALVRSGAEITDEDWLGSLREVAGETGVTRLPRLVQTERVTTAMAGGMWRSIIFVPPTARAWDAELRRVVLAHELTHLKHRDPLRHLIGRVAVASYWLHPLAWVALRRADMAREAACDEAVLALGVRRSTYARMLLSLAEVAGPVPATAAALPIVQPSHLENRLMAILGAPNPNRATGRRLALMSTCGLFVLAASIAAMRPVPPKSSQAPPAAPVAPSAPVAPAAPAAPKAPQASAEPTRAETAQSTCPSSGFNGTTLNQTLNGLTVCFQATNVDGTRNNLAPSDLVARASRVVIETHDTNGTKRMEIGRPPNGNEWTVWLVNGTPRPMDGATEAWQKSTLGTLDTLWANTSHEPDVAVVAPVVAEPQIALKALADLNVQADVALQYRARAALDAAQQNGSDERLAALRSQIEAENMAVERLEQQIAALESDSKGADVTAQRQAEMASRYSEMVAKASVDANRAKQAAIEKLQALKAKLEASMQSESATSDLKQHLLEELNDLNDAIAALGK